MKLSTKPVEKRRLLWREDFRNKEIEKELRKNIGRLAIIEYANPNPTPYSINDDGIIIMQKRPGEYADTLRRELGVYSVSSAQIPLPAVKSIYYTNKRNHSIPERTLVIGLDESYIEGTRIIPQESEKFSDLIKRIFSRPKLH